MRVILKLLPAALSSVGAITPVITISYGLNSFKTTSFRLDGISTKMTWVVKASSTENCQVKVLVINDMYPSGVSLYEKTYKISSSENYVYDNRYTRTTNKIKVICKNLKTNAVTEAETSINLASSSTYRISGSPYTYTSSSKAYVYTKSWKITTEQFKFVNFNDLYVPDYFHKIDLSYFYINDVSSINNSIEYKTIYFYISNDLGFFSDFDQAGGYARIPLKLVKSSSKYTLAFLNDVYVHKETLEMSPIQKPGYVKTKYFYLPRNEKQKESSFNCNIQFKEFGLSKDNFVYSFNYKSILNTFGNCGNSEYCIVNS